MLTNYLKIAWRSLLKNKVTGFINIAGLAIGMAVALMIGLWLKDELEFNTYHKNYDRLAQVMINQDFNDIVGTGRAVSLPTRPAMGEFLGTDIENISLSSWNFSHVLAYGEKSIIRHGLYVEPVFPEMISLEMIHGNYEDALKDPYSIVISEKLARIFFGAKDPMGKVLTLDTDTDVKVTGVFKDLPRNTTLHDSEIFIPWELYKIQQPWVERSESNWGNHSFQMFAQITEQASFAGVTAKIRDVEKEHNPSSNPEYFLFPMSKWHLYSDFENGVSTGGRIQYVWLFGIIGVFVLFLACINFMNLSTARSERRAKEVGIRKTIGSMRSQLIGQFLSESLLVAGIAMVFALLLTYFPLSWFNEIADKDLNIPHSNPYFWMIVLGFTLFTGLLAGSYPAFYLSSFKPLTVLKGTFQAGRWAQVPRQVLVTAQFTISVALIIGTLVVYQQIQHAKERPIGYDRSHVIHMLSNQETYTKGEVLRNDLLKTGLIEEVAYSNSPITNVWSNTSSIDWEGKDPEVNSNFAQITCSPEFGKTVGWQIKEGRDFSRVFSRDSLSLVVNETAAEYIGLDNLVGRDIELNGAAYKVIGIVKDILMESPWLPVKPTTFRLNEEMVNVHTVRFKEDAPVQDAIAAVQTSFNKISPSSPFEFDFVDEEFNEKFESEERIGKLSYVFAFLAIFISCLGLFGLSAFVAEQRTKEIGIRKVLGATVTNLWAMQSKGFVRLVLLSCLLATPLAWYFLEGWLADYDYRIELDWTVFVVAAILALIVTLLTVSYQSIRAALINPVESLKDE